MNLKPDTPTPEKTKRVARPWTRRVIVAVILAIVLAVAGGQIVLWSDIPRRIALTSLERLLGMQVSADSLSTGWFGSSTLRGVSLSLPLASEPLLKAPEVRCDHTSLLAILLGGSIQIERLEILRPELTICEVARGRWNITQLVELAARDQAAQASAGVFRRITATNLPDIVVDDAVVQVIDLLGHKATIAPLDLNGHRDGQLVYGFDASCARRLRINGSLVPGASWLHQGRIQVEDVGEWIRPFAPAWPDSSALGAGWRGTVVGDGINGRLEIASLVFGDITANGVLDASITGASLFLHRFDVLLNGVVDGTARVTAGTVTVDSRSMSAQALRIETDEGNVQLTGLWDRVAQTAKAQAEWRNLRLPVAGSHSGSFAATLQTAFPDRPQIDINVTSAGHVEAVGRWDAQLKLHAEGDSYNELNWKANASRVLIAGKRAVDLSGLTLFGRSIGRTLLVLDDISIPQRGRLTGRGRIDVDEKEWWLWLSGGDFALVDPGIQAANFDVNAWGSFDGATFDKVYLAAGGAELWMNGIYDAKRNPPLALDAWLTRLPDLEEETDYLRGRLRGDFHLAGASPLDLKLKGQLYARNLAVGRRSIGDITAKIEGEVSSESLYVETRKLELFRASWDLSARWPTLNLSEPAEVSVRVDDLPLAEVSSLLAAPQLSGTASAELDLKMPSLRSDLIVADGRFSGRDVTGSGFHADSISTNLTVRNGRLRLDPLDLTEGTGRAQCVAEADLVRPAYWYLTAAVDDWPVRIEGADGSILFDGKTTQLQIDLSNRAAYGELWTSTEFSSGGSRVGAASIDLVADGRTVYATRIDADLLGGAITGRAKVDLQRPMQSTAKIDWRDLDTSRLRVWFPELEELSGRFTGGLTAGPAQGPNPLAPLQIAFRLDAPDGAIGAIALRNINLNAFVNLERPGMWLHLVTPDASLGLAGGDVEMFARLTIRDDGTRALLMTGEFQRLSLDQIVHAVDPTADRMPGLLSGRYMLGGDPRVPREVFGETYVALDEADLDNSDPLELLYKSTHVEGPRRSPLGTGFVRARLENRNIEVTRLFLLTRGLEVRGTGTIYDVFMLPDSEMHLMLVGMSRPLKAIRLPFMATADQIVTAIQTSATTVEVGGTVREPSMRLTSFENLTQGMRSMLLGDAQTAKSSR